MIQSASYLVCLGKRERKKDREKKERKKEKEVREKKDKEKEKNCEEKKQNSDLSRLNLVVEFGLESVLCIV